MSPVIVQASGFILLALALYSIGVWSERFSRRLRLWHLLFFWSGLIADFAGTGMMITMRESIVINLHSVIGYAGIALMLVHTVWASFIVLLNKERLLNTFHRFSVGVWWLWLASLISGVALGVSSVH